jgi:hypothetical protein
MLMSFCGTEIIILPKYEDKLAFIKKTVTFTLSATTEILNYLKP